ncbi:MAG: hypothetical protein WDN69_04175 [Aliidongia sp.]
MTVPIELRYAGVALASFVLLIIGWRLRETRRAYGLILQGGAVRHPLSRPSSRRCGSTR